jgi:hypothetical protein
MGIIQHQLNYHLQNSQFYYGMQRSRYMMRRILVRRLNSRNSVIYGKHGGHGKPEDDGKRGKEGLPPQM